MGLFGKKKDDAPAVDMASLRPISTSELAQNNHARSLWMSIDGLVYDVTTWQNDVSHSCISWSIYVV